MELENALILASHVVNELTPHCERIIIAGSIRREKPFVNDIEIVCIPRGVTAEITTVVSLFGEKNTTIQHTPPVKGFIDCVNQWEKSKGEPTGRYTRRWITKHIEADIFMCTPINWGYILGIRTGSGDFSKYKLGAGWTANGYRGEHGYLFKGEELIRVHTEKELFELAGVPWVEPKFREI